MATKREHDRGMLLLALALARQDARAARRGSAEQHDACNRGAHCRMALMRDYGMTEAEIEATPVMRGAVA